MVISSDCAEDYIIRNDSKLVINPDRVRRPTARPMDLRPLVILGFFLAGNTSARENLRSLRASLEALNFTDKPFVEIYEYSFSISGDRIEDEKRSKAQQKGALASLLR